MKKREEAKRKPLSNLKNPCPSARHLYPISSVVFPHFFKKKTAFMRMGAGFWKLWPRVPGGRMNRGFSRVYADWLDGW
jgi:hypothetical protein